MGPSDEAKPKPDPAPAPPFTFGSSSSPSAASSNPAPTASPFNKVWTGSSGAGGQVGGGARTGAAPSTSTLRPPKPIFGNRSAVFNNPSSSSSSSASGSASTSAASQGALLTPTPTPSASGLSAFAPSFTPSTGAPAAAATTSAGPSTPRAEPSPSSSLSFVPSSVFGGSKSSGAASSTNQGQISPSTSLKTSSFGNISSLPSTGATTVFGGGFKSTPGSTTPFGTAPGESSSEKSAFGSTTSDGGFGSTSFGSSNAPFSNKSAFGGALTTSAFGAPGVGGGGAMSGFGSAQNVGGSTFGGGGKTVFRAGDGGMDATPLPTHLASKSQAVPFAPASSSASKGGMDGSSASGPLSFKPTLSTSTTSNPVAESSKLVQATMPAAEASSRFSSFMRPGSSLQSASSNGTSSTSTSGARNALGGSVKEDEERRKRFEDMPKENRFLELKAQREVLRAQYIRQGILPDPEKQLDLSQAQSLKGTCPTMCPEFEREEREFQNEGDEVEMFPGTNRIDPTLAVKIYRRPAAGRELPLPEDVRPAPVLRRTLDYLFYSLMPSSPSSPTFTAVQGFLWNRTRAIRQDFIVQSESGALTVECHERIARFHILSVHWKGGVGNESWSEQQELEQLRKTIRSLTEFYDDLRSKHGQTSPNEGEFRAYNLLLHFRDPDTLREIESLPAPIFDHPSVQAALRLRELAQRSNSAARRAGSSNTEATANMWSRFFEELKSNGNVNYLMACLAENLFNSIRMGALKAMSNTYLVQHNPLPIEYIKRTMGMDDEEEAADFVRRVAKFEEVRKEGGPNEGRLVGFKVCKGTLLEDKALPSPFSHTIVEAKRASHTAQDIVDGRASGAVPLLTEIDGQSLDSQDTLPKPTAGLRKAGEAISTMAKAGEIGTKSIVGQSLELRKVPEEGKTVSFANQVDVAPTPPPREEASTRSVTSAFGPPMTTTTTTTMGFKGSAFGGGGTTTSNGFGSPAFGAGAGTSASATPSLSSAFGAPKSSAPSFGSDVDKNQQREISSGFSFASRPLESSFGAAGTELGSATSTTTTTAKPVTAARPASSSFSFATSGPEKARAEAIKVPATAIESKPSIPSFFPTATSTEDGEAKGKGQEAATKATTAPVLKPAGEPSAPTPVKWEAARPVEEVRLSPPPNDWKRKASVSKTSPTISVPKMVDHALAHVVPDAVQRLAIQALEDEAKRRRSEVRSQLVSRLCHDLFENALIQVVDGRVQKTSSIALARNARRRSLQRDMLSRWTGRLEEEREMKLQARRLVEVRERLQRRAERLGEGVKALTPSGREGWARRSILFGERHLRDSASRSKSKSTSSLASLRSALLPSSLRNSNVGTMEVGSREEDEAMQLDFCEAAERRRMLWARGTFSRTLLHHVDRIVTPAVVGFGVAFSPSTMPREGVTSLWLAMKLHLDGKRHAQRESENGVLVHTTRLDDEEALKEVDGEDDLGLVIFECSPELVRQEEGNGFFDDSEEELERAWAAERKRLEDIGGRKGVRASRFVPALLLVDWHRSDGDEAAEVKRKRLFARLGLTALSELRSAWSNVGLLEVDAALATANVDEAFAGALEDVLPGLAWNSARRMMRLESIGEAMARPCQEVGHHLDVVFQRAKLRSSQHGQKDDEEGERGASTERLARSSVELCIAIVNLALRCIVDVSDLLIEEATSLELPLLRVARVSSSPLPLSLDDVLFDTAITYLEDDTFDNDQDRPLVQHLVQGLIEVRAVSNPFSHSTLLTSLHRLIMWRCQPVWISALDDVESTLSSHASNLSNLGLRGVAEILALVPAAPSSSRPRSTSSDVRTLGPRKRGAPNSALDMGMDVDGAGAQENFKTSETSEDKDRPTSPFKRPRAATTSEPTANGIKAKTRAVGSLKEAMDAARALLSDASSGDAR